MALTKIPGHLLDKSAHVDFADNEQLRIGTGNDLVLKHTGSNTVIHNTTGQLRVRANDLSIQSYGNEEKYIEASENGSVDLYYDNSKKFETTSSGVTITGVAVADGLDLGDNEKIRLGASQDLEIYHTGSHSYIKDAGTGNITVQTNNINFINAAGSQFLSKFVESGAVELYHNGNKKFETTGYGATVTGDLRVGTAVTVYGNAGIVSATAFYGDGSKLTGVAAAGSGGGALDITSCLFILSLIHI